MRYIRPILNQKDVSKFLLTALHDALPRFWEVGNTWNPIPIDIPDEATFQDEVLNGDYGPITKQVVSDFRTKHSGLGNGEWVHTATAKTMNELLLAGELIGKVSGSLIDKDKENSEPVKRRKVRVLSSDLGTVDSDKLQPVDTITDKDGAFESFVDLIDTEPRHLQFKAFVGGGGDEKETGTSLEFVRALDISTKPIVKERTRIEIRVDTKLIPEKVEFKLVEDGLTKKMKDAGISKDVMALQEGDARILAKLDGDPDQEQIEHFVIAQLLAFAAKSLVGGSNQPDAGLLYGLLRQAKFAFVSFINLAPSARVTFDLATFGQRIIPDGQGGTLDAHESERFRLLAHLAFYSEFSQPDSADEGLKYGVSSELALSSAIQEAVRSWIIEDSYLGDETAADPSGALQRLLELAYRRKLAEMRLEFCKQRWDQLKPFAPSLPFHQLVDSSGALCRIGDEIGSDTVIKRIVAAPEFAKLPEVVRGIAKAIVDAQAANSGANKNLRDFRLMSGNVYHLATESNWKQETTDALLSLQRLALLTMPPNGTPNVGEMAFLFGQKLDSAWKIVRNSMAAFRKAYVKELCSNPLDEALLAASQAQAEVLYKRARERTEVTAHLFAEAKALSTAQHVEAIVPKKDREQLRSSMKEKKGLMPNWEQLFGSLDSCDCEHCQSIYSPGSYLVDVLEYFKRLDASDKGESKTKGAGQTVTTSTAAPASTGSHGCDCLGTAKGTGSIFDVLMKRRGDIGYLDLNCANTNTAIPYIDLVCELLEDFIKEHTCEITQKIEPGVITDQLRNLLHTEGFTQITSEARVTLDSHDNRLVRDEGILILFKHDGNNGGCPVWKVKQLRQTYGTEAEVGAAPEYVNQAAYTLLKTSHLCLELPFDTDRTEADAYLGKLDTDRAAIMRSLSTAADVVPETVGTDRPTNWKKVATEQADLTQTERELITQPDPTHQHEYWSESSTEVVKNMSQFQHFLDKTDLKTAPVEKSEVDELLAGEFINPNGQTITLVSDEPTNPLTRCDTTYMHLHRWSSADNAYTGDITKSDLDRIHRFLRLWRKVKWPINLLDRLITSFGHGKPNPLDDNFIGELGGIIHLAKEWGMEPVKLAAWFTTISTYGPHSDYRRIFLQKRDDGHPYTPFLLANLVPTGAVGAQPTVMQHAKEVAGALGIRQDYMTILLAYWSSPAGGADPGHLSLRNLSRLSGWFRVSRKLGLAIPELLDLLLMLGISDVLASSYVTRRIWEIVSIFKRRHIKVADVRFWLLHQAENDEELNKRVIPDLAIIKALADIRKEFITIAEASKALEITQWQPAIQTTKPDGTPGTPILRPGDGIAACLAKIGAVLAQVPTEDFPPETAARFLNLLQLSQSPAEVSEFQAILASKGLNKIKGRDTNVASLAASSPVHATVPWTEDLENPQDTLHISYQSWLESLRAKLLLVLDQLRREEAVIRVVSQQTKAPVEQVAAILERGRMPTATGPTTGEQMLKLLIADNWASAPVKEGPGGDSDARKEEIKALWKAAFATTDEELQALQPLQKTFRDAVLKSTFFTTWPSANLTVPEVESWRSRLSPLCVALRLAHKVASLAKALKLDTEEHLRWGLFTELGATQNRMQLLGWFSPDDVPISGTQGPPQKVPAIPQWIALLEGIGLLEFYPLTETQADPNTKEGAASALEMALKPAPLDPVTGNPSTGIAAITDILRLCYRLFGTPDLDMTEVARYLNFSRTDYQKGKTYERLKTACDMIQKLGFPLDKLSDVTAETVTRELVLVLRQCLKYQSDADTWLATLKEIQDPLREMKRDALVAYLLANPNHTCFKEVNDLYDHFLIDPQMCACMPTSRIVQAHAVVQLFAQRSLMGQESGVDPRADDNDGDDWKEWQWMRNYRVWEANRKVFLYPENWIEPELRDDKSQFFKELEQTLQQADVNDTNVEAAARIYLDKLDDAAFMEVMAIHYQSNVFQENGNTEGRVLHVVARTKGGDPHIYYYRRFVDEEWWTPWEKIDLDIATDHVLLFVRNTRLVLAWPVFTDVADENVESSEFPTDQKAIPRAKRGWTIQLAISERSNGRWQPKRISKEAIRTDPLLKATSDQMSKERSRCRFFIRDREPKENFYTIPEGNPDALGFFIVAYGFLIAFTDGDHKGELVPEGSQQQPRPFGAFNLAGCKGYPELASSTELSKITNAAASVPIPRIRDVAFVGQRWEEQANDAYEKFTIEGLLANNLAPTDVFDKTPGTFKVTTTMQTTIVDDTILKSLQLLNQEPKEWHPAGVFVPLFYEDGRRGYVAVPTARSRGEGKTNTISDLAPNLEVLYPDFKTHKSWPELLKYWKNLADTDKDNRTAKAFIQLEDQLSSCFGLEFLPFYHPFVCLMKRSLAAGGFERLMNASAVAWTPPASFQELYVPQAAVLAPYPAETTGFSFDRRDGYGGYNWEVFYHLPSLVSQKLTVDQKFEDAIRWCHFVFNPSGIPDPAEVFDGANSPPKLKGSGRYWVTKPFQLRSNKPNLLNRESYVGQRIESILSLLNDPDHAGIGEEWQKEVTLWRRHPFVPHLVARGRTVAFQKATFMRYLDALIQWGDFLFRQDTRESDNAALQLYITAEKLLGKRPRVVKAPGTFQSRTYRELEALICGEAKGIDGFGNSLVQLENLLPAQRHNDCDCKRAMPPLPAGCLASEPYFCTPRNEKLMGYWDTVEDRLYKIRHCQNIEGVERQLALFAPPIDPGLLVRALASGLSIGDVLAQGAGQTPHYRFQVLAQKATELIQMVITLGNGLLQVIEKKDAEALAQLRSSHEINLLKLVKDVKLKQIAEAEQTLAGLRNAKVTTLARRDYYQNLKKTIAFEERALDLMASADGNERTALTLHTLANVFHLIPNFDAGACGFGGSPVVKFSFGGQELGNATGAIAQYFSGMSSLDRSGSGTQSTKAGHERRWEEWQQQLKTTNLELLQMERQIAAAEVHVDIAKDELRNHEKQIEQSEEVLAYMKDRKFTNQELYDWMVGQISATYFQAWQMAHRFTLRVERAFHFELGPKNDRGEFDQYVRFDSWDSLHKGLLAGEKLLFDLKRLETEYLERNRRDFEITKHISLVRLDPMQFLKLKHDGKCEIELPDWLFDMDYPGQYFRRIKSVSLSIPCVVGSYANVNCTLTLTKSRIRIKPKVDEGEEDEPNILRNFSRIQSIATSGAQNDSGMFEVNFRDDRYLPFEGAGAVSTWTLELNRQDNRQIDFDTITDVILHLKYTSRFGGGGFQKQRREAVNNLWLGNKPDSEGPEAPENPVQRLFLLKDEFPAQWRLVRDDVKEQTLTLTGIKDRMPYFWQPLKPAANDQVKFFDSEGKMVNGTLVIEAADGQAPGDEEKWKFTWRNPAIGSKLAAMLVQTSIGGN